MVQAEKLVLDAKFDEAIPLLKKRLIENPADAGAHYYLARCYQFGTKPWLAVAQGELETALHDFYTHGKKSPIARFQDNYFEMICYIDIGKIRLRQLIVVTERGGALTDVQPLLDSGREAAEKAKQIIPDANEVKELEERLSQIEKTLRLLRPPNEPPRGEVAPMT